MIDNKNIILAVVLSIIILVGFDMFFAKDRPAPPPGEQPGTEKTAPGTTSAPTSTPTPSQTPGIPAVPSKPGAAIPSVPGAPGAAVPGAPGVPSAGEWRSARKAILEKGSRVRISTPSLHGSINLTGGGIDDLSLVRYRETLDPASPEIVLLIPKGAEKAYYAEFGWVAGDGQPVPGPETPWRANRGALGSETPVTLTWDNGQGLKFSRTYAVDENYMFTVTQKVVNSGSKPATLYPYGLLSRRGTPEVTGFYILHEGLMGVSDGTLEEIDYDEIQEQVQIKKTAQGGWIGITDKYWLAALVPDQKVKGNSRFTYRKESGDDLYQVDYLSDPVTVAPGGAGESRNLLFAGAKEVTVIDAYNEDLGIDRFDLAIDFGWFYFLTKPIFYALLYINEVVLNFGVSILLLTVAIKIVFFPLANKSYASMSKMKKLQPEMTKLRERYGDDKTKLNEEMMALYKREKANPASGCLPILIQIPVFFALYKVLFVNIEMRQAPFFGWIKDLSVADPTSVFNLFGMIPWTPPEFLIVGVWPLIMGISMYVQQKLNPQPTDPMQAKIFLFLPILFTFLLARFPAGLVIYWAWNNILSMGQQWVIMRRMGITGKQALK
ncbi:MAG: membrane protein insertase YidC [Rhodospirillaceae bacterium]|jgi:YidC/Oxa1 family membrane protein insertase|nr:membrane protein insertase YidC [Rhodospirillaceae bacterium]|tara:strand:+ start:451 stop:2271 length:1821 start_codon:yes stop_codon:yes gene_type:complete